MNGLKKVWYSLDDVIFKVVWFIIFACMTALVIIATIQVLLRYFLSMPMRWSNEFCCFMLVYDVFLGAAYGLRNGEHVVLDISKLPLPVVVKKIFGIISNTAVYVFLGIYTYYGYLFSMKNGSSLTEVMKWPYITLYCILPISGVLMIIGHTTCLLRKTDKKEVAS